jgi:sensor histidine kinase YesM
MRRPPDGHTASGRERLNPVNVLFYSALFLVTQIAGVLVSLVIGFVLQDFTWGFVRVALVNSLIVGLALIGSCYLCQRLMFRMRIAYIALISFSLVLGVSIISFLAVLFLEPTVFIYYGRGALAFIFVNFLFIIALHVISTSLIIYREITVDKEKAIGAERYLRNQIEMQLLSSRVNPHFLFNTLNMILTLLKTPAQAEAAILNLSDLLRENLDQSEKARIPVARELENVRKYLELQKLRFSEKLQYVIQSDADFSIPPLVIQPLVENSIKHNIQKVAQLTIDITVSRRDGRNRITVIDSARAVDESMLGQGKGLTITKKRVENGNGTFLIRGGGIEMAFGQ